VQHTGRFSGKKARTEPENLSKKSSGEYRIVQRAKLVLMSAEGLSDVEIGKTLTLNDNTVATWRNRYIEEGTLGLYDRLRSERPPEHDKNLIKKKICILLEKSSPKKCRTFRDGTLLAKTLKIPKHIVWSILRIAGIKLQTFQTWCVSKDPKFVELMHNIRRLYCNPPKGEIVLCLDEKTSIQALERLCGYVRTKSEKIIRGVKSTYKR
jgi:transposase